MTFNITNASLISSLSTFVAEAVAADRENNPLRITDSDIAAVKDAVLADLDDVDAAAVAEKISVCDIAELIDPSEIAKNVSARSIAREIDSSDIADSIAQSLDLSEIAQQIDVSDLAQYIDADSSEIASNLYEDESFVEKVARKINVSAASDDHATVEARSVATLAMIDARIAAASERIAEQVTQRVLAQIGNTLVALLSGGAKPQ